jgi:hypothetical protein
MSAFIVNHKHIDALVSAMLDAHMSYWDGHKTGYTLRAPMLKKPGASYSRKTCAQSCIVTVVGLGTTKNRPRIHIVLFMPYGLGRQCRLLRRCIASIINRVKPRIGKPRWRGGFARRFFRTLRRDCPAMRPRPGRSSIDREIFPVGRQKVPLERNCENASRANQGSTASGPTRPVRTRRRCPTQIPADGCGEI